MPISMFIKRDGLIGLVKIAWVLFVLSSRLVKKGYYKNNGLAWDRIRVFGIVEN